MSHDIQNIVDFIKFVKYPEDVAVAILVNDTLNLNAREDNISSYESVPENDKFKLVVNLSRSVRTEEFGNTYNGRVVIIYDKIDATKVFPNGFYSHKYPGSSTFKLSSLLDILKKNTKITIKEEDIELIEDEGKSYIEFKPSSIFWKGRIELKSMESITYHDTGA